MSRRGDEKMDDALKEVVSEVLKEHFVRIKELTQQQFEILKSIFIEAKDTFAILPTGHGKSLPFYMAPVVAQHLGRKAGFEGFLKQDIVLVISPLLAIMDTQVKQLNDAGIPACSLHDEKAKPEDLSLGHFKVVFGSPEAWVKSSKWQKMLKSNIYQERLLLLVADEAHCIPTW